MVVIFLEVHHNLFLKLPLGFSIQAETDMHPVILWQWSTWRCNFPIACPHQVLRHHSDLALGHGLQDSSWDFPWLHGSTVVEWSWEVWVLAVACILDVELRSWPWNSVSCDEYNVCAKWLEYNSHSRTLVVAFIWYTISTLTAVWVNFSLVYRRAALGQVVL